MDAEQLLDGATVLMISRPDSALRSSRNLFAQAGLDVIDAPTGLEGLTTAEQHTDIAIVDPDLPDMSGLDVAAALKLNPLTQPIPVILQSSGVVSDAERVRGLDAGADLYISGTVSGDVLLSLMASQLRQRELSRQLELALSGDASGVYDWSIPTGQVRWTESIARMHRIELDDFGGTFDDFVATVHPDDREHVGQTIEAALDGGDRFSVSFRFLRADGSIGWMESQGRVFRRLDGTAVRLLGLANDVTERVVARLNTEQLRRLASELSAARTAQRVLTVLAAELDGSSVVPAFTPVDDDAAPAVDDGALPGTGGDAADGDIVFSSATVSGRLQLVRCDDRRSDARPMTKRQATAIGELASTALDRASRFEAERTNAIALRKALLPPTSPEIDGWVIDTTYLPATQFERLGGDFFDVIELESSFVVLIGDVAGHGLGATAQMGTVRTLLRTLAVSCDGDPLQVVSEARALFARVCGAGAPFASACVARCAHDGAVSIVCAGHPPPIAHRAGQSSIVDVVAGPPLGTFVDVVDAATTAQLEDGAWLGFYTDGVVERRNRPLLESVADLAGMLGGDVTAAQVIEAGEDAEGALNADDRAVVIVRRERSR